MQKRTVVRMRKKDRIWIQPLPVINLSKFEKFREENRRIFYKLNYLRMNLFRYIRNTFFEAMYAIILWNKSSEYRIRIRKVKHTGSGSSPL